MTDTLDDLHARAALDRLDANVALTVFDGAVPNPFPGLPFVLVYTDIRWPAGEEGIGNALDHDSVSCRTTWYIHCVAATAAACRALSMQVREALLDFAPTISGRNCTRLTMDDAQPPSKDEMTGTTVFDAVVVYSMTSVPG